MKQACQPMLSQGGSLAMCSNAGNVAGWKQARSVCRHSQRQSLPTRCCLKHAAKHGVNSLQLGKHVMGSLHGCGCCVGIHLKSNSEELQLLVICPDWLQHCGQQLTWVQVELLSRQPKLGSVKVNLHRHSSILVSMSQPHGMFDQLHNKHGQTLVRLTLCAWQKRLDRLHAEQWHSPRGHLAVCNNLAHTYGAQEWTKTTADA